MKGRKVLARRISSVAAALLVVIPMWAHAETTIKFAFLDTQKVFDESKAGQKAKGLLEEYVKSRQKIIDLEESEIKDMEDRLIKQESVLSEESKRAKQEDLQRKLAAYQRKAAELNREIQEKKVEVLSDFHGMLQTVVKRVADREGIAMVFDKGGNGPADVAALLYANESLSITAKVLAELDKGTK